MFAIVEEGGSGIRDDTKTEERQIFPDRFAAFPISLATATARLAMFGLERPH